MRHAVIMAGGAGTRLWPLSRKLRPKQLLRLFNGESLLRIARQRLEGLFDPRNIWVITSEHYIDQVAEELPDLPRENLIGEPMGRDTANAIGLAANMLARRDPDATMAVFTADHIITPQERFAAAICTGLATAEKFGDSLITFGITPLGARREYGYLHRGERVAPGVYRVAEFKEKPEQDVAEQYVRSGEYYWNSGMFAWRASAILAELERLLPDNARDLTELAVNWGRLAGTQAGADRFERLHKTSIDYGVMERARSVLLVEMSCDWRDLGSWVSIANEHDPDEGGNVAVAARAMAVGGKNNILVSESDHLLITLGVSDVIVVHSDDATLVCRRDQVEKIKQLGELRTQRFGPDYE